MRKKTAGLVLAAAGAVLILSALLLLFHNRQEDRQAGERYQAVLEELRRVATDDATLPVGSLAATEGPEATQVPEMPTAQIDGYDYIGTLTIPALELELPVMAQWDYDRLTIAPCRQFGTTQTDDLVIAAHNYIVLVFSISISLLPPYFSSFCSPVRSQNTTVRATPPEVQVYRVRA